MTTKTEYSANAQQESPAGARVTSDSVVIPRWPSVSKFYHDLLVQIYFTCKGGMRREGPTPKYAPERTISGWQFFLLPPHFFYIKLDRLQTSQQHQTSIVGTTSEPTTTTMIIIITSFITSIVDNQRVQQKHKEPAPAGWVNNTVVKWH